MYIIINHKALYHDMTQFRHLSVGLYIVTFTGAHGKIHSPLGSMAEEPHIRRRRIAALDNPSTESDFSITCQTDRVLFKPDRLITSIVRRCTINSFGSFTDSVALSCDSSLLTGVSCEMSPSSIMISHDSSEREVTVIIQATDDALAEDEGEVLVSASYVTDVKSSSIPVIIGYQDESDNPPMTMTNEGSVDFFLLSGQSNMIGHTTSGASIGSNDAYWLEVKGILEGDPNVMEDMLYDAIYAANSGVSSGAELEVVASTLTNETMKLYNGGLLNNLDTPLSLGR